MGTGTGTTPGTDSDDPGDTGSSPEATGGSAPTSGPIVAAVALVGAEVLAVVVYLLVAPVTPTAPLYYAVPFVWLNGGLWAVVRVDPPAVTGGRRVVAGALALGYLAVLGYVGGLWTASTGPEATGLRVAWSLPPGWGPAVVYGGKHAVLTVLPFKLGGYAALAYLVYATVLDATGSVAAGVLGLFSCVSCTLPIVAGVVSGAVGGAGVLVSAALAQSYPLSTAVYLVTVALLVWRPTPESFSRLRPN